MKLINLHPCWSIVIGVVILFIFAYFMTGQEFDEECASAFGALATGFGVIIAAFTLLVMKKQSAFEITASVHNKMNEEKSYLSRQYLFTDFNRYSPYQIHEG